MKSSKNGYSYKVTITAEDMRNTTVGGYSREADSYIQPPMISANRIPTKDVEYTTGDIPHFVFNKIVEPRFDGMGIHTGQPYNFPDFISEYHFISLMRVVEKFLQPHYEAAIKATGNTTGAK